MPQISHCSGVSRRGASPASSDRSAMMPSHRGPRDACRRARAILRGPRRYTSQLMQVTQPRRTVAAGAARKRPATALDAQVREIVALAFRSGDRLPVLARLRARSSGGIRAARSTGSTTCSGSARSRTNGSAAGRCSAGCREACADKPVYVFETGGTTGIPKTRIACDDFRIDYELFSDTLPDEYFPEGRELADARPVRPAAAAAGGRAPGPVPRRHLLLRRSRSALGDQADQEGVDGAPPGLQGARASTRRSRSCRPDHDIKCMFTTPKLLEALALRLETMGTTIRKTGITGIFSGGTEFTPQWTRFAHEELLDGAYMTPTYGNTLMGLAAQRADRPAQQLQDHLLRAAAAGGDRGRRLRRPEQGRRLRRRPAA